MEQPQRKEDRFLLIVLIAGGLALGLIVGASPIGGFNVWSVAICLIYVAIAVALVLRVRFKKYQRH